MARCNCSPRCDVCGDGPCDCTCTNAEKKAHLTKSATGKCFCDRMYPESDIDASCGDCPKRDYKARPAQAVDVCDLCHELYAMAQGQQPISDAVTAMELRLTRALTGEKAGPVDGWLPIETAPIDETVFCYHPMVGRFPGYQSRIDGTSSVTWHNTWSRESGVMPPTLWQPLPTSPAPDKEGL